MAAVPKPPAIKAMKHQAESLKVMARTIPTRLFDMSDPGTGKTFVEIIAFDKVRKKGETLLVLAPKSLLESAWAEDIKKFAPHLLVSVAWAENREEAFAAPADIYITNHDAVNWLAKKPKAFFKRFVRVVVDESTAFRNPNSQRSKALNKIRAHFRDRIAMSGTPNPRSITDIFNQVMFIDDGKRLGQSFFAFRQAVCAPVQVGPRREMVRWEDKEGAEEAVFALLADMTIRHRFQDCIDIPENFQYTMPYKMPTKQLRAYKEMAMTQLAAVQGKVINAINAAAVRTKLLQIASGAVYEHSEQYHLVDAGRYELVMDLVEDRKHSIVFFLWQHQRDFMVAEAEKRGLKYCVIDGKTPVKKRTEMVTDYQAGFYQVLFAHPASAAHGLTLTRATTTIWPSPTDNLEWFVQGNKRAFRNGQKQKTETIIVLSDVAVEQAVYKNLMGKDARMGNLLDLFAGL